MSYCRWGWDASDVYIYATGIGDQHALVCCGCKDGCCDTYGDMLHHISAHRAAGQHVPAYVDERLRTEMADPAEQWVPVGEVPETMHPDPGPQRPEPEHFTLLKAALAKARKEEDHGQTT